MINIEYPESTTYWILKNTQNKYIQGQTEPNQITNANENWQIHLITTDKGEWERACEPLGLQPPNNRRTPDGQE